MPDQVRHDIELRKSIVLINEMTTHFRNAKPGYTINTFQSLRFCRTGLLALNLIQGPGVFLYYFFRERCRIKPGMTSVFITSSFSGMTSSSGITYGFERRLS